jgi:pimeloyl-ACP methyl ester carboxylesterase
MFITHAGAELYTVEFGNSPRTLVAHGGWAGSWELWVETFSLLSNTWRCVAYDHRGIGATVAPAESISIESMVDDLFAILDWLEIDQCVLAAESSGVAVALRAALEQSHRFTGLVLVDGLYYRSMPIDPEPFILGLQHDFQGTIGRFVDNCVLESEPNSAAIRRWGRQILMRSPQAAAIRLYECLYGLDLKPNVSQILQPTLIIHGELDTIVPLADAEWLATQIPNSHLQIIRGAGHVPTVTRPGVVAEVMNRFFDLKGVS